MAFSMIVNRGATRPTIQASTSSRPMRMNIAMNKPRRRANSCRALGSLSTKIEIKMMLSIPSTNSNAVSVAKAIQVCGLERSSIMQVPVGSFKSVAEINGFCLSAVVALFDTAWGMGNPKVGKGDRQAHGQGLLTRRSGPGGSPDLRTFIGWQTHSPPPKMGSRCEACRQSTGCVAGLRSTTPSPRLFHVRGRRAGRQRTK